MQFNGNLGTSIEKFFQDYASKSGVQKESSKLEFKTFYQKHVKLSKVLPVVHYGLLSVFSVGTACFYLADKVFAMLPVLAAAVFFALVLLAFWEYGKSYLLSSLFESWYYGLTHTGKGSTNFPAAVACLIMLGGSVFLSVSGASVAALKLADKGTEIKEAGKVSLDSLNGVYASKIAKFEADIDSIEQHKHKRWGGLLSASENKQILNLQNRIAQTEASKGAEVQTRLTLIQDNSNKSLTKAENTAAVLVAISSINELLIMACVWFGWFFAYKVRNEKQILASSSGGNDTLYIEHLLRTLNLTGVSFSSEGGASLSNSPLGFDYNGERIDGERKTVNVEKETGKACKDCGNTFEAKHWNAQYCSDSCRISNWETRTGKKVKKGKRNS